MDSGWGRGVVGGLQYCTVLQYHTMWKGRGRRPIGARTPWYLFRWLYRTPGVKGKWPRAITLAINLLNWSNLFPVKPRKRADMDTSVHEKGHFAPKCALRRTSIFAARCLLIWFLQRGNKSSGLLLVPISWRRICCNANRPLHGKKGNLTAFWNWTRSWSALSGSRLGLAQLTPFTSLIVYLIFLKGRNICKSVLLLVYSAKAFTAGFLSCKEEWKQFN